MTSPYVRNAIVLRDMQHALHCLAEDCLPHAEDRATMYRNAGITERDIEMFDEQALELERIYRRLFP